MPYTADAAEPAKGTPDRLGATAQATKRRSGLRTLLVLVDRHADDHPGSDP